MSAVMNESTQILALQARIDSALADGEAARAAVRQLVRDCTIARAEVFRLRGRLLRIKGRARSALARTRDPFVQMVLWDVAVAADLDDAA